MWINFLYSFNGKCPLSFVGGTSHSQTMSSTHSSLSPFVYRHSLLHRPTHQYHLRHSLMLQSLILSSHVREQPTLIRNLQRKDFDMSSVFVFKNIYFLDWHGKQN
jgi:hypothetical protein